MPQPQEQADASSEKLRRINEELTQAKRTQIVEEEALLRELQEAPDSPEAIATLPRLSVADIQDAPEEPRYYLVQDSPLPCLRHDVATRGIVYAYRYYDIEHLEFEDLPYLSILALVLGNENDGLAQETIDACDYTVRIPMRHGVDSLNVSMAAGIAFWELRPR